MIRQTFFFHCTIQGPKFLYLGQCYVNTIDLKRFLVSIHLLTDDVVSVAQSCIGIYLGVIWCHGKKLLS